MTQTHFDANGAIARQILKDIAAITTPACPRGLHEYKYEAGLIEIVCHLDMEMAERGSRENGLQMEPDYPAQMTLHAAYIGSIDVVGQLENKVIADIEEAAEEYFL
jgi:hypothetical protein